MSTYNTVFENDPPEPERREQKAASQELLQVVTTLGVGVTLELLAEIMYCNGRDFQERGGSFYELGGLALRCADRVKTTAVIWKDADLDQS